MIEILKNEIDDFRKKILEIPEKIKNFDEDTCEDIGNDLIKLFEEGFECLQNCNDCLSSIENQELNESIANIAELKRVEDDLTLAKEHFAEYIEWCIDKIFKNFIDPNIYTNDKYLYEESPYYDIFSAICEIYLKKENVLLLGDLFSLSIVYTILQKGRCLYGLDETCEYASEYILDMVKNNLIKSPETFWQKNYEILLNGLWELSIFYEFTKYEDMCVAYENMILALLKIAHLVPNHDESIVSSFGREIDSINNPEIKKIFEELYPNYKLEVAVEDLIQSKWENCVLSIKSVMEDNFSFLEKICDLIEKDKQLLCEKKTFKKYKNAVLLFLKNANSIFDDSKDVEDVSIDSSSTSDDSFSISKLAEKIKDSILKVENKIELFNDPKIIAAYNGTIENFCKNNSLDLKKKFLVECDSGDDEDSNVSKSNYESDYGFEDDPSIEKESEEELNSSESFEPVKEPAIKVVLGKEKQEEWKSYESAILEKLKKEKNTKNIVKQFKNL